MTKIYSFQIDLIKYYTNTNYTYEEIKSDLNKLPNNINKDKILNSEYIKNHLRKQKLLILKELSNEGKRKHH